MENEAVLRLFDMYADDMFRLAYSYLGSRQEAEDVVQDVFEAYKIGYRNYKWEKNRTC